MPTVEILLLTTLRRSTYIILSVFYKSQDTYEQPICKHVYKISDAQCVVSEDTVIFRRRRPLRYGEARPQIGGQVGVLQRVKQEAIDVREVAIAQTMLCRLFYY